MSKLLTVEEVARSLAALLRLFTTGSAVGGFGASF